MKIVLSVSVPVLTLLVAGAWNLHHTGLSSPLTSSIRVYPSESAESAESASPKISDHPFESAESASPKISDHPFESAESALPKISDHPFESAESALPKISDHLSESAESALPKIWTKTTRLYKGETLELRFSAPNAPFLGVIDPKGHFFYVVFPRASAVGKLTPLVDSERFTSMRRLKINTGSFKADPYTYGVYTNQPVFTQSGTYTFILGDNLHIDDPDLVQKVQVRYVHSRRPSPASTDIAMH